MLSFELPISLNKSEEKYIPIKVINIERINPYTIALYEYIDAANLLFEPNEVAIKELQPATIPIPAATIIKYKGKLFANAAKAS